MMRSLERAGAVEKHGGLWSVTEAGREMSAILAILARPAGGCDRIDFDYGEWERADAAFDHAAYDAKCRASAGTASTLDDWMSASGRIMKGAERPPWKPSAMYNRHGDGLQVCLCDADGYTQWLCPGVEVVRAISDRSIVGFSVWGLSRVVAEGGGELRNPPDGDGAPAAADIARPPGYNAPESEVHDD